MTETLVTRKASAPTVQRSRFENLFRRVVVAFLIVLTPGCTVPVRVPGTPTDEVEYHVAPPDVLTISIRPAPEITRDVVVRPDGRISLDLIGDVVVQGKTLEEIRREITDRAEKFILHPDVTVILSESNSRQYHVFGEVMSPGAYPLVGDVNMLNALASAGGPTNFAKLDAAWLVRPTEGDSLTYEVDFEEITRRGDATTNYELQPGDVVYVPPVLMVRIGYVVGQIFFPFTQILGIVATALIWDRQSD